MYGMHPRKVIEKWKKTEKEEEDNGLEVSFLEAGSFKVIPV